MKNLSYSMYSGFYAEPACRRQGGGIIYMIPNVESDAIQALLISFEE
ncbi:hypothetical protein [Ekhidna sp.]